MLFEHWLKNVSMFLRRLHLVSQTPVRPLAYF